MKKKILIFSPHPDDECLGLGGTICKFIKLKYQIKVCFISGHLPPLYKINAFKKTKAEAEKAMHILGVNNYNFLEIPATTINQIPTSDFNEILDNQILKFKPNIVFIPFPDRHIDHKLTFESAMVVTRPIKRYNFIELVACYETLSETHWNASGIEPQFTPNWFVDIEKEINQKIKAMKIYKSQINNKYYSRSVEAAKSLANFRGSQNGFKYAEAFQIVRKLN